MKIAIITGGENTETEISIQSAKEINRILSKNYKVKLLYYPSDLKNLQDFDIAIPVIHGRGGEDGELQEILNDIGIKYIFSKPATHRTCIDKSLTKKYLEEINILSPKSVSINECDFNKSYIVKQIDGGSSINVQLINNKQDLDEVMQAMSDNYLIEEYISGREFSVPVIDFMGDNLTLPITEIIKQGGIFDHKQKYDADYLAEEIIPARIDEKLAQRLSDMSIKIHEYLECEDISRIDFIVNDKMDIYFIEINTIPGMTATSLVPKCLNEAGIKADELFEYWINKALNQ